MKISLQWLRRLTPLTATPDDIAKTLTGLGLEVEELELKGMGLKEVVCAEVMSCEKHPGADKLSLCQVYDGTQTLQIVCGAPNVSKGQKVILARIGAVLPGNFAIKHAKIRGVESFGMLCAEDELGLGTSHDGIMVLPADTSVGIPIENITGLCDAILTVNVTPNRPDALSHIGIARELAAAYGLPLNLPAPSSAAKYTSIAKECDGLVLDVQDKKACPRYTARIIRGIKVGPSPDWLKRFLAAVGQKSINNVVDITNFVLLEWGQPSHVFDLDVLVGNKVCIRRAHESEKFIALDDIERTLTPLDLVIADNEKAQCMAGVMGGRLSGVSDTTTNLLLEVAYFDPPTVRTASKRHGLMSDSSYRFERGIDPQNTLRVSEVITSLILEIAGGIASPVLLEEKSSEYNFNSKTVWLRESKVHQLLGIHPTMQEICNKLSGIGLTVHTQEKDRALFTIPGFRPDIEVEVDLIEEVARLFDYNQIPDLLPSFTIADTTLPPMEALTQKIRHHLASAGLCEALSLRFTSPTYLEQLGYTSDELKSNAVWLKNPLSEEWRILPLSTSPLLLQAVLNNQKISEKNALLFEIGKGFSDDSAKRSDKYSGVRETPMLSIALWGAWPMASWDNADAQISFHRAKGIIDDLWKLLGITPTLHSGVKKLESAHTSAPHIHPVESVSWEYNGTIIGWMGSIHPAAKNKVDIKGACFLAEILLEPLLKIDLIKRFVPFSKQSSVEREINVLVDESMTHQQILALIPLDKTPNLRSIQLNSIYTGQGIPDGKKAMHYTFAYRHPDKSLTDDEVNGWQAALAKKLLENPAISYK